MKRKKESEIKSLTIGIVLGMIALEVINYMLNNI